MANRLLNRAGKIFTTEAEVQLAFGLVWCKSEFDINREPNNERGPGDFKASFGAGDKSLIAFNSALTPSSSATCRIRWRSTRRPTGRGPRSRVIVYYTAKDERRVKKILEELKTRRSRSS